MINDILNKRAMKNPHKGFITYKNKQISYAQFNSMVNNYYDTLKTKKHEYVGLQIKDKLKLLIAIIALNRKKSIPVIYPNHPNIEEYLYTTKTPVVIKDFKLIVCENVFYRQYVYDEKDTQLVMFTSGSSGNPKPCELTYGNFNESSKTWDEIIQFNHNDVYLNHMPLTHVSGMCIFFRALYSNFEIILDDFNINNYIKYSQRTTLVSMVPAMLEMICNKIKDTRLQQMKAVIVGGDNINNKLIEKIKTNKIPAYVSYGLTESCSGIAGAWVSEFSKNLVYNAHQQVTISLSDKALTIISPTIIKKYFNSKKLFNNRFITSDCVEIIEKNKFKFKNRLDDIVVSGGENISINYVKKQLLKYKGVKSCSIEIINDKRWDQAMHAILVIEKNIDKQKFQKNIIKLLPKHMIPKKITIQ